MFVESHRDPTSIRCVNETFWGLEEDEGKTTKAEGK